MITYQFQVKNFAAKNIKISKLDRYVGWIEAHQKTKTGEYSTDDMEIAKRILKLRN